MKSFFGYVRVSTPKQGLGVSLDEQRAAIAAFATAHGMHVSSWFEERETAAKRGRPVFGRMLSALRGGQASGVVIHKIDRSARNLKDWAELGDLIDSGCEIHFAADAMDLTSRGGRLSADIQAVVAADYIRNLREETRKGFYGRLKQGLYPLRAPVGYLDRGRGRPKELDPVKAPLVRLAFQLYASRGHSLDALRTHLFGLGLTGHSGAMLSLNGMSTVLNNPFYTGIIRIRRSGSFFQGVHTPIVSTVLFEKVHQVLKGKLAPRSQVHNFLFRGLLRCAACRRGLTGELKKGRVYYRCHTRTCRPTSVREDVVWSVVLEAYNRSTAFSEVQLVEIRGLIADLEKQVREDRTGRTQSLKLTTAQGEKRLDALTDAFVDGLIDKDAYQSRKRRLLLEQQRLRELVLAGDADDEIHRHVEETFELIKTLQLSAELAFDEEKRDLLDRTTSNFSVRGKNVAVELRSPLRELENCSLFPLSDPHRGDVRTSATAANDNMAPTPKEIAALILKSAEAAAEDAKRKREGRAAA